MSEQLPKEVKYKDPEGKEQIGWYLNGHVYQDEAATIPIAVGSTFRSRNGITYRMTPYGGVKWSSSKQYDKDGNWIPQGNHWFRTAQDLAEQLKNRPAFSYDPQTDPFYQGAKSQYLRQGSRAMRDTVGQTAGLTGGYGSSYSQLAGQQAYQTQLTELSRILPGLYDRAKARYDGENDALIKALNEAAGLYDLEYQTYLDRMDAARKNREADRKDRELDLDSAHWDADFAEDLRRWEAEFAEGQRRWNEDADRKDRELDLDSAHWDADFEEKLRRWEAEFAEDLRRWNEDAARKDREADRKDRELDLDSAHWDADFAEDLRRWEAEFAQRRQEWADKQQNNRDSAEASADKTERSYAFRMAMLALQQGLSVSNELLTAAGIDPAYAEMIRRYYANLRAN